MAAALVAAAPAAADKRMSATTGSRYVETEVSIDQGERLTFFNGDVLDHSVTSYADGPNGRALFDSGLLGPLQEGPVEGVQYLPAGRYPFYCTLHSFMTGALTVTGAGAPAPRPADTTPAQVSATIATGSLPAVQRTGRIPVRVRSDEAATVRLAATIRAGRRALALGTGKVTLAAVGSRAGAIRLTAAGRRALRERRSVVVTVTARATDAAGNASAATARRTLRRPS